MIYGIGTDICDIRRIRAALERRGERFAQTVLGDAELAVYHERRSRWPDRAEAFQVHRLADDALNGVSGLVEYSDHFNRF